MECELQPWATFANADKLVVATIDIAPEASEDTAMRLLKPFADTALQHEVRVVGGDFGKAFWRVVPQLGNHGVRADVAAWYPWVDTRGAMRCLSNTVGIFLLGGCLKVRQLFSP